MPITTSAKKKLRQDAKRQKLNLAARNAVSNAVKKFKKSKSEKLLSEAYSAIDRVLKKKIIHKNKAARMKSSLSKLLGTKKSAAKPAPATKPVAKKKTAKKTAKK